ncbi:MAG: hypothetical protein ACLQMT_13190 [Candidatus Acidiferrales bacterium]
MREIGVLLLVFVPLEVTFESKGTVLFHYPLWLYGTLNWLTPERFAIVFFILIAVVMLYFGIKLETKATMEIEAKERRRPQ